MRVVTSAHYLRAATQDIAVDGWAVDLSTSNFKSMGGVAQTVGMNIGYFMVRISAHATWQQRRSACLVSYTWRECVQFIVLRSATLRP